MKVGSLPGLWALDIIASALPGVLGLASLYVLDGWTPLAALDMTWPMGLLAGGVGALVIAAPPPLTLWAMWEIYLLDAPNDFNAIVLVISLPATITTGLIAGLNHAARRPRQRRRVWMKTLVLAPLTVTAVLIVARWAETL